MNVSNATPLKFAPIVGRLSFPGHSLTLIVKGTFDLAPGADAKLAEQRPYPTGDEYYPDDEEQTGGPRYEADFAYYKPRTDLLLVGTCYAPGGQPTRQCPVTFRVGDRSKTLTVSGNRYWERRGLRWRASEPERFTEMELRYEHAFGGDKVAANPVGKGATPVVDEQGYEWRPLPNIEDPAHAVKSPKSRPPPAGFGPLGRMWETRHAKMGTYKGSYLETRWPWFPEDFDWTHFNAAPEDMQVDGYLRGDENLYFENLHPVHGQYHSRLPGLRVRCFIDGLITPDTEQTEFVEVAMNLDTLWADMEAEKLVLVWRGWTEVSSEDYEEVRDVFIMSEPLADAPATVEQCRQRFLDFVAAQEEAEEVEPEEPAGEAEEAPAAPTDREPAISSAELEAQANALMVQMGIDVQHLPPEVKAKQSRLFKKLTETDPDKLAAMERQEIDEQLREALGKLDLDPNHLPPLSAKAKAEQLRFMKELGVKPTDVSADPELGKFMAMLGAMMPKMGMDPENLDPLIAQAKQQQLRMKGQFGVDEEDEGKEEPAPALTREIVAERAARGESLAGENLQGLDLSGLEMPGIDFSEAKLSGARLAGAKLQAAIFAAAEMEGADLSSADLSGANLAGADLSKAKLDGARLESADLTGAVLTGATLVEAVLIDGVLEKAQMAGAALDRVEAKDAIFAEADLTEARFKESNCAGADFSQAVLDKAQFQRSRLPEAMVQGAVGREINFADADLTKLRASGGCDFSGGIFWRVKGADSNWEGADLTGADFRGARMPAAVFTGACLERADLSAADVQSGRFDKAGLREAKLVQMNLFQGNLAKADLTAADLSGSNLYGAESLDAVLDGARFDGANLKMTKLHAIAET